MTQTGVLMVRAGGGWSTVGFPNAGGGALKIMAPDGWHVADNDAATAVTVTSRPGSDDGAAPADFECGDNDVTTSRTPVFEEGEAHGDYGLTFVTDAANTIPFPTTGSETIPDLTGVVSQQGHVIYTSTWPVSVGITSGDEGELAFPGGGPAGTEVQVDSDIVTVGGNFLSAGRLFTGGFGAPETYGVTVHEWWIVTEVSAAIRSGRLKLLNDDGDWQHVSWMRAT